jgi:hypothetical protein
MLAPVPAVHLLLALVVPPQASVPAPPVSLRGSPAAMVQQHAVAVEHGLTFYRTEAQIRSAAERGELVELPGDDNYEVAGFVHLPYVRPEARRFIERTAELYRDACGEPLVVTSGVRAIANQPPNAHQLSVHPAGIAVDLRVSQQQQCRAWLEQKLMHLERQGVINGIREFRPPHYHVAVFPEPYVDYLEVHAPAEPEPEPAELVQEEAERSITAALVVLLLLIGGGTLFVLLRRRRMRERELVG